MKASTILEEDEEESLDENGNKVEIRSEQVVLENQIQNEGMGQQVGTAAPAPRMRHASYCWIPVNGSAETKKDVGQRQR